MSVDVLFMRHGETEANVRQVLVGHGDSPFTDAGREHPREVALTLEPLSLNCVYVSPMERARRTAELVVDALDCRVPMKTATAIAEIDAGEFTGLTFDEVRDCVRERAPDLSRFGSFRYPGGESWQDVQTRAVNFAAYLEEDHASQCVLLVTHAGVIASLVAHTLDEPLEQHIRIRYGHDYLGRLRVEGGRFLDYARLAGTVDVWF